MAAVQGNCIQLYYQDAADDTAPTSFSGLTAVTGITSCNFSVTNATFEATSIVDSSCNTRREFAVGTTSGSMSIEGIIDNTLGGDEIFAKCEAKTKLDLIWGDGTHGIAGVGFCTNFEISAGMDDFVTFSASFELSGTPSSIGFD